MMTAMIHPIALYSNSIYIQAYYRGIVDWHSLSREDTPGVMIRTSRLISAFSYKHGGGTNRDMRWLCRYDMSNDVHRRGKQTGTLGHVTLSPVKRGWGKCQLDWRTTGTGTCIKPLMKIGD